MNSPRCFLGLVLGALASQALSAAEWHVGPGQRFADIRSAIAAAGDGDTIQVHAGTYHEGSLILERPVTLMGRNRPRIDGGKRGNVITVVASQVTVSGFEITGAGASSLHDYAGIKVANASGVMLEDNRIVGCTFGIFLSRVRDGMMRGNDVRGAAAGGSENGNGIHAWSCERLELIDNTVERHRDGIYLEFVTDSRITGNRVSDCLRYGLHFMFSHRDVYRRNVFLGNGAGVAVMYSRGVEMDGNVFSRSWGSAAYGLLLKDLNDGRVAGNVFEFNSVAVTVQNSTRMRFEGNQFRGNGWALQVESSSTDNMYLNNNFVGNAFDLCTTGELASNRFEGNFWDKAEIYDLNRDGVGDVPHRPLSLFAKLVDRVPSALLLLRSPLVLVLDRAERVFPTLTPDRLFDPHPAMRPHPFPPVIEPPAGAVRKTPRAIRAAPPRENETPFGRSHAPD